MGEDTGTSAAIAGQLDTQASKSPSEAAEEPVRVLPLQRNGVSRSHKARRYPCSMCSEIFTRQEHRRRHELSHQDERPFACGTCGFKAARKDAIQRHARTKHPEVAANAGDRLAEPMMSDADTSLYTSSPHSHHGSVAGSSMAGGSEQLVGVGAVGSNSGPNNLADGTFPIDSNPSPSFAMPNTESGRAGHVHPWPLAGTQNASLLAPDVDAVLSAAGTGASASADATNVLPQMELQFVDDYLFQWLSADYIQMPTWGDVLGRMPMDASHLLQQQHQAEQPGQHQQSNQLLSGADDRGDYQSSGLFWELTPADMNQVELRLHMHDVGQRLVDFRLPSRYFVIRSIKAFFAYFTPHTPVIHAPTFHVTTCPPPLLLAIMACGAVHVNESEVGKLLHHAVLKLLNETDGSILEGNSEPEVQVWEVQTRLLACQFGLFSGDRRLRREARLSFPKLCMLCQEACHEAERRRATSWSQWIVSETAVRCIAWVNTLSAVLLCDDETPLVQLPAPFIDAPLPCDEARWAADATDWQNRSNKAGQEEAATPKTLLSDAYRWLVTGGITLNSRASISPFGMLVLVSALLSQICMMRAAQTMHTVRHELRRDLGQQLPRPSISAGAAGADDEVLMQKALAAWEEAWKIHPHSTTLPEAPHGPLMADSILLLNTAYGRLYADEPLRQMRALARLPPGTLRPEQIERLFSPSSSLKTPWQNDAAKQNLNKALLRACRSLVIRVHLGIRHMAKTASLTYACYGPLPAYEGSLLIAWNCLGRRLAKLPGSSDPMVDRILDEVVAESQYSQRTRVQRETIAMILYRDLIRERWIWKACDAIVERLDNVIQTFQLLLEGHSVS
ncbi:hypothetical protein SEUCBS140593_010356 [Sporothrix eucalyptigena]|uniref:C2H2-type domain-containing protein n=1 Tax=Sporothrix eucalyptigena TaxID=1812306 RepID=A0ABP0D4T5_9PEZI